MPSLTVRHDGEVRFVVDIRGHEVATDQPIADGGRDTGPAPVELFVASLATCVAFYARRYLERHGLPDEPIDVVATYSMGSSPARVARIDVAIVVPEGVPAARRSALLAVASHCTVHNTLTTPPDVDIRLADAAESAA